MNKICLTGDTHGNATGEMRKLSSKRFQGSEGGTLIILGDFGFLFNNKDFPQHKWSILYDNIVEL